MKILREELEDSLYKYVTEQNGIVSGGPGLGKSFTLAKVQEMLVETGIPAIIVSIDRYLSGDEEELRKELDLEISFIEQLKLVEKSDTQNAVLIFDGFDAARDDVVRNNFLKFIEKAISELALWKIIVSIREFDATKNEKLLSLFPKTFSSKHSSSKIKCRNFIIPELTNEETKNTVQAISVRALSAYDKFPVKFQNILRSPFSLWLLEQVFEESTSEEISALYSEIQLFNLFWKKKVIGDEKTENLLSDITKKMVETKKLSIDKAFVDLEKHSVELTKLLSNEMMTEVSAFQRRLSFSHNILFDYAVTRYLFSEDSREFSNFIRDNKSAVIFLRPSLLYYFNNLWYFNREVFWKNVGDFLTEKEPSIGIMAKTIPFSVILKESSGFADIDPIFTIKLEARKNAFRYLLYGIPTLDVRPDILAHVYLKLSNNISIEFAWNLGANVKALLDKTKDADVAIVCSDVALKLHSWILKNKNDQWGTSLISSWCLPTLLQSFPINSSKTEKIIDKIINTIGQPNFDITSIYRIIQDMDEIIKHSSDITSRIYKAIFAYKENADTSVDFGSPVLPLRSTRKQDYGMCYYLLNENFNLFLSCDFIKAIETAVICTQMEIKRERLDNKNDVRVREIEFDGALVKVVFDYSYIWGRRGVGDADALQMMDKAVAAIEGRLDTDAQFSLQSILNIWKENVEVAYLWKILLTIGTVHPGKIHHELLGFFLDVDVLTSSDFEYEVGMFLQANFGLYVESDRAKIEKVVMSLPVKAERPDLIQYLERDRDRYISNLPPEFFVTAEVQTHFQALKDQNKKIELKKMAPIETHWGKYTDEDYLKDQGVDFSVGTNQALLDIKRSLEVDTKRLEAKELEVIKDNNYLLNVLNISFEAFKKQPNNKVAISLFNELLNLADKLVYEMLDSQSSLFVKIKEIVLLASEHAEPVFNQKYHGNFESPSWSPDPRIEAAQTIFKLLEIELNDELLTVAKKLIDDPVPAVRYLAVREIFRLYSSSPDGFFKIANLIAENESNGAILGALMQSLRYIIYKETDRSVAVLSKIKPDKLTKHSKDLYSNTVCWLLVIDPPNPWALDIYNQIKTDMIKNSHFLSNVTLTFCSYLEYRSFAKDRQEFEIAKKYLIELIDSSERSLIRLVENKSSMVEEDFSKLVHDIYEVVDETITRLYFSFDFKEDNRRFEGVEMPSEQSRFDYYNAIEPIIERIIVYCCNDKAGIMFAPTAHYFMKMMNIILPFNPANVLRFSQKVVLASSKYSYNLDHMAVREVVQLVDELLASHKHEIQDENSIKSLILLLDAFADVGWPEALNRVWKLDEIFR